MIVANAAHTVNGNQALIVGLAAALTTGLAAWWSTHRSASVQQTGFVFAGQQHFVTSVLADNEQLRTENHDLHSGLKAALKRIGQLEGFIRSLGKDPPPEA